MEEIYCSLVSRKSLSPICFSFGMWHHPLQSIGNEDLFEFLVQTARHLRLRESHLFAIIFETRMNIAFLKDLFRVVGEIRN